MVKENFYFIFLRVFFFIYHSDLPKRTMAYDTSYIIYLMFCKAAKKGHSLIYIYYILTAMFHHQPPFLSHSWLKQTKNMNIFCVRKPKRTLTIKPFIVATIETMTSDFKFFATLLQVLDPESIFMPPLAIENMCVSDVVWHRGDVDVNGKATKVFLNATLHWSYPTRLQRYFRVYWRHVRGPDPRVGPGPPVLIGRAYSTVYRVVEIEVGHKSGVIDLLVEPVSREGCCLPESHWGRQSLSYTQSST